MITPAAKTITQENYPMRTVPAITGVNPVTLRAWERRYDLIKPWITYRERALDAIARFNENHLNSLYNQAIMTNHKGE
jgi:hypothetical protein